MLHGVLSPFQDEIFDSSSSVRAASTSLYESVRQGGSAAALLESLQAQLKQRDGELMQLQTELAQAERARLQTQSEVARLAAKAARADELQEEVAQLRTAFTAVEQKYQTMLTVGGGGNLQRMSPCELHW